MRKIQRWLPLLLVGLPLLGAVAFGGGIVVTDHLEEDNTFCTACHLHEKKFTEFHPVDGKRITLAAAHNITGDKNVKCIDCHSVHPTASAETRFLREPTLKPLCDTCHKDMEQ